MHLYAESRGNVDTCLCVDGGWFSGVLNCAPSACNCAPFCVYVCVVV